MRLSFSSGPIRGTFVCLLPVFALSCGSGGNGGSDDPDLVQLDVSVSGTGHGTVTGSVGGIACTATAGTSSGTCQGSLSFGSDVRLTATPANGSTFTGWSGACSGTSADCNLELREDASVSAAFALSPVTVTISGLPRAREGVAYAGQLSASGGTGSFLWSVASGALPPGITLGAGGELTGAPTTRGSYDFTARATSGTISGDGAFTIPVDSALPPLEFITTQLPAAIRGVPYTATLEARGGIPPYRWSIVNGLMPGLQLASEGVVSGTPGVAGNFTITIQLTSSAIGLVATREFTIRVAQPFAIEPEALSPGAMGIAYGVNLTALSAQGPVTWSVSNGALPDGLVLNEVGRIEGVPLSIGSFTFTVRATDGQQMAEKEYTIVIDPAQLAIVPPFIETQIIGQPFSLQLQAVGGIGNYVWSVVLGTLPPGITLTANGLLSGTPTQATSQFFVIRVQSGAQMAEVNITLTVTPPPGPPTIAIVAGDGQTSHAGDLVPGLLSVAVRDYTGAPLSSQVVNLTVEQGGGVLSSAVIGTNVSGIASLGGWRLGPAPGTQSVRASIPSGDVVFSANALPLPPSEFNIVVRFGGTIDPGVQAAFEVAAQRWERVLRGDLADVPLNVPADPSGCAPAINETVDDLLIYVRVSAIDGPGQILASAGPRLIRSAGGLPVLGCMLFDVADLNTLAADGRWVDVISHEMGHVLGVGTLWPTFGLLQGAGAPNPTYSGAWGLAGLHWIGGPLHLIVPVENFGGPGTRDVHWRESVFGNELMTGFIAPPGVFNPLSAITTASLRDMGYFTADTEAEPHIISSVPSLRADPRALKLSEALPPWPVEVVGADGKRAPLRR